MDFLTALDVIIGLFFVFLVFSLLATSINEAIAALLDSRARSMCEAIGRLLGDTQGSAASGAGERIRRLVTNLPRQLVGRPGDADRAAPFYSHPLIRAITKDGGLSGSKPAYIPSRAALTALLDTARDEYARGRFLMVASEIRNTIDKLPAEAPVKAILADLWADAKGDVGEFVARFDKWFEGFGDQVSSWYRQKTQVVLLLISVTVAGALNVDTIAIMKQLSINKGARSALVALAEKEVASTAESTSAVLEQARAGVEEKRANLEKARKTPGVQTVAGSTKSDKAATTQPSADVATAEAEYQTALAGLASARKSVSEKADDKLNAVKASGLVLGWEQFSVPDSGSTFGSMLFWLGKILGILLTAFAMTLGAPFWFDMLKKFFVVRSVGMGFKERLEAERKKASE